MSECLDEEGAYGCDERWEDEVEVWVKEGRCWEVDVQLRRRKQKRGELGLKRSVALLKCHRTGSRVATPLKVQDVYKVHPDGR